MPDKEQRVQVTTLLLFALFAGVRPAELVDTSLSTKEKKAIQDAFWRQTNLCDDPQNSDYNDAETNPFDTFRAFLQIMIFATRRKNARNSLPS